MPKKRRSDQPGAPQRAPDELTDDISPQIGGRLRRLAQSRGGLVSIVRRFTMSHGEDGLRMLVRRLDVSIDDVEAIRRDIGRNMDSDKPTSEFPGSAGKLAAMRAREARGFSVFQAGDAVVDLR